jgi:hypothetical protein
MEKVQKSSNSVCYTSSELFTIDIVFVGKFESKRTLGRPRCRGEIIVKWISYAAGYDGVHWIHVAQTRN